MRKYKFCLGFSIVSLVAASLLLLMHPSTVHADDPIAVPYVIHEISNCTQLQAMNNELNDRYVLTQDIDCSDTVNWNGGTGFIPIGLNSDGSNHTAFNGELDGYGHTISDLFIDRSALPNDDYTGFIASTYYQGKNYLRNFKLSGAIIISNQQYTGGIVAFANSTTLDRIQFDGTIIMGCNSHTSYIGGLVGYGTNGVNIQRSSTTGSILGARNVCTEDHDLVTGGLVGIITENSKIENSYSMMDLTNDVSDTVHSFNTIGGLAGIASSTQIISSYAGGNLTIGSNNPDHDFGYNVGGIVGGLQFDSPSFANVFTQAAIHTPVCNTNCGDTPRQQGAILGNHDSDVDLSTTYYDQLVAGVSDCDGAQFVTNCNAVNTSGDPDPTYFENNSTNPPLDQWDFYDVWQTSSGLPILKYFDPYPTQPVDLVATINSTSSLHLTWAPPVTIGDDNQIDFYEIIYRKVGTTDWKVIEDHSTPEYDLVNLSASTAYEIKVVADIGKGYYGPASESVQATTATPGFYLVSDCQDLQDINVDLTGNYELTQNIDCSDTINWNGGAGFTPIGYFDGQSLLSFVGILAGNNYTISNLVSDQEIGGQLINGLFVGTVGALIQDLRLDNFRITGGFYKGTLSALDSASTITNVQITNALLDGTAINAGGMVGYELPQSFQGTYTTGATQSRNSFSGIIHNEASSSSSQDGSLGGMYSIVLGSNVGGLTITNNYVNATVIDDNNTPAMGQFIGNIQADDVSGRDLTVTNNYAAGELTKSVHDPDNDERMGGLVGVMGGDQPRGGALDVSNSFNHVQITDVVDNPHLAGLTATADGLDDTVGWESIYFDADLAGTSECVTNIVLSPCNAISGQPNYFYNNHTNPPLNHWDFDHIWETTSTLPVFNAATTATITAIPEERLTPKTKPTTSPTVIIPAAPTDSPEATYGPLAGGIVGETPAPVAKEGGLVGKIRELLRSIPAGVLVSFPYVAMGALALGALALLVETVRQVRRLREINLLIAKQNRIADERDTFWHLAANYLRAPITLLMGGVELLNTPALAKSLGAAVAATAKISSKTGVDKSQVGAITKLVTSMQSKVAGIMEQIEKSSSLQGITRPKLNTGQKVSRQLRFWIPLLSVGALIILTNYVARGYRHLNVSTLSLITQVVIFVVVAMALYWILGALGIVQGKRKQAEALLAKQSAALDGARSTLISKTAEALDGDVAKLDGLLESLPKKEPALPIMREGSTRLRHMVDSFHLLISAQNNQLNTLSPRSAKSKLSTILDATLKSLEPEITSKHLAIDRSNFGNVAVPGSEAVIDQVISSVLSNAVDFSPRGGKITISVISLGGGTKVTISDQGPGISKDQLNRVFQLFNKADGQNALQMDHGGLGIDLYLDRLIMDYLDGDIAIDSTVGEGTTLTITWPENQKASDKLDLKSADTASPYLA